jgi:hypothetical protein
MHSKQRSTGGHLKGSHSKRRLQTICGGCCVRHGPDKRLAARRGQDGIARLDQCGRTGDQLPVLRDVLAESEAGVKADGGGMNASMHGGLRAGEQPRPDTANDVAAVLGSRA